MVSTTIKRASAQEMVWVWGGLLILSGAAHILSFWGTWLLYTYAEKQGYSGIGAVVVVVTLLVLAGVGLFAAIDSWHRFRRTTEV